MQIVELMRMVPENEDDGLAKVALFTKFMELLPVALQSQEPSMPLVKDLLRSMREVLTVNQTTHQTLFRFDSQLMQPKFFPKREKRQLRLLSGSAGTRTLDLSHAKRSLYHRSSKP